MSKTIEIRISGGKPNVKMTKAEEIEMLEKIAEQFKGSQTYLEQLFSEKMLAWCRYQIGNDFSCDMAEELRSCEKTITEMSKKDDEHDIEIETAQKLIETAQKLILELRKDVEAKLQAWRDAQDEIREVKRQRNDAMVNKNWMEQLIQQERELAEEMKKKHELELVYLKAKLFDLNEMIESKRLMIEA